MIKRKKEPRLRSKIKIKKKMAFSPGKPRLSIYRSLNNIYAQIIDDSSGKTLVSASTLSKDIKEEVKSQKGKIVKSKLIGNLLARKALEQNISEVVFDRNGFRYHGRVQALAEGAREGGLKF
jgi:large subunit ribosomal protein L18